MEKYINELRRLVHSEIVDGKVSVEAETLLFLLSHIVGQEMEVRRFQQVIDNQAFGYRVVEVARMERNNRLMDDFIEETMFGNDTADAIRNRATEVQDEMNKTGQIIHI